MIVGVDPGRTTAWCFLGGDDKPTFEVVRYEGDFYDYWIATKTIVAEMADFKDTIVIEDYRNMGFNTPKARGASMIAHEHGRFIGTICCLAWDYHNPVVFVTAGQVRKWLCNKVSAGRNDIKQALADKGYDMRSNEHTRDALATALYYREVLSDDR